MYQVGSHGIGYCWDDTNWGMIYTTIITMWNDCIIDCPKYWPGIERVCRWNMKRSYQINHNLKLHIFYCKSRWMIAKVWHDTPNLVYTIITTYHNTLTAAGYEQSTEYNIVYMHSTYMLFWCKYLKEIYILHLLLCCPKIGICAHHIYIYKLKVVSKRMNIIHCAA